MTSDYSRLFPLALSFVVLACGAPVSSDGTEQGDPDETPSQDDSGPTTAMNADTDSSSDSATGGTSGTPSTASGGEMSATGGNGATDEGTCLERLDDCTAPSIETANDCNLNLTLNLGANPCQNQIDLEGCSAPFLNALIDCHDQNVGCENPVTENSRCGTACQASPCLQSVVTTCTPDEHLACMTGLLDCQRACQ